MDVYLCSIPLQRHREVIPRQRDTLADQLEADSRLTTSVPMQARSRCPHCGEPDTRRD